VVVSGGTDGIYLGRIVTGTAGRVETRPSRTTKHPTAGRVETRPSRTTKHPTAGRAEARPSRTTKHPTAGRAVWRATLPRGRVVLLFSCRANTKLF
jgi:hypothetical protein